VSDLGNAIAAALQSPESIPKERVVAWCREAQDVETLALLYRLTGEAYERIEPPLGKDETCSLIRRYLLECIRLDPQDGVALTRYEAAWTLQAWFDHLAGGPEKAGDVLLETAAAVTRLYLDGDSAVREAIETGFLEHVLEQERLRPLFEHWHADERLREAWQAALAWGEAHPGFTKGLREKLKSREDAQE